MILYIEICFVLHAFAYGNVRGYSQVKLKTLLQNKILKYS
jgi:hypothetical protein